MRAIVVPQIGSPLLLLPTTQRLTETDHWIPPIAFLAVSPEHYSLPYARSLGPNIAA
jgi:hypothetical protein